MGTQKEKILLLLGNTRTLEHILSDMDNDALDALLNRVNIVIDKLKTDNNNRSTESRRKLLDTIRDKIINEGYDKTEVAMCFRRKD